MTLYQYDETSGYYYDPVTTLYYDANSQVSFGQKEHSSIFEAYGKRESLKVNENTL